MSVAVVAVLVVGLVKGGDGTRERDDGNRDGVGVRGSGGGDWTRPSYGAVGGGSVRKINYLLTTPTRTEPEHNNAQPNQNKQDENGGAH